MMSEDEPRICSNLPEYEVAMMLSGQRSPCAELREQIATWMSRCCESCCEKKYRVLRIAELAALCGLSDPVDAWMAVHDAVSSGKRRGKGFRECLGLVIHKLMEEEERLRFNSPRGGLEAMEEAHRVLDELEPPSARDFLVDSACFEEPQAPGRFGALRALVEARLGNALRYNSRIPEARLWLAKAAHFVRTHKVPAVVYAEVSGLFAEVLSCSGQLSAALEAAQESIDIYDSFDSHRAATEMIFLAQVLHQTGRPAEESLQILEEAMVRIDGLRSPHILYVCRVQITLFSLRANNIKRAADSLSGLAPSNHETTELRRQGIGGFIDLARGEYRAAGKCFERVGNRFIELGMTYDAALLMLYRGEALLRLGETARSLTQLRKAFELLSALDACEAERRSFRDLLKVAQVGTAEEIIGRIRGLASEMGGCLSSPAEKTPTDEGYP